MSEPSGPLDRNAAPSAPRRTPQRAGAEPNGARVLGRASVQVSTGEGPAALVRDLFAALQIMRLRGRNDPRTLAHAEEFQRTLRHLAEQSGRCRLVRSGPTLFVGGMRIRPVPEIRLAVQSLALDLERARLGGFEWDAGLRLDAILEFLERYRKLGERRGGSVREGSAADQGNGAPSPSAALDDEVFLPGIRLLPVSQPAPEGAALDADRRAEARRVFFCALDGARHLMRHFAHNRVPELRKSRALVHEMIDSLVEEEYSLLGLSAIQNFDRYTFQHSVHVSVLSMALGQGLGLPRRDLADLGVAALFHDLGKVQVPKQVLLKPGRFDSHEWSVMRTHPLAGARELLLYGGSSELAVKVMIVSAEHHMRFDGSGYPRLGKDWSQGLFSRIVSLADCFDAMTASRAYVERPFTPDSVVRYMIENSGRLFDPDLLRLFVGKVGLYPVGSMVRLESGELALVVEPPRTPNEEAHPRVCLLERGASGWELRGDRVLATGAAVDPRFRVQAGCHPQDHGLDVDSILSRVYLQEA